MLQIKISQCCIIEGRYVTEDQIPYRSYGIQWQIVSDNTQAFYKVEDISTNRNYVKHLVFLLNNGQVSGLHLFDFVLDSIS